MSQTVLYCIAAPDVLTQQAASEGGGLHWTLRDDGAGTFDAINRGDLIVYGDLVGVALTDFNLDTDAVAIDVFGAWYLPVTCDVEIGDWIFFHTGGTLDITPASGKPIGQAMATDSSWTSAAIAVPVKLWPQCVDLTQPWDPADLEDTVTYRMPLTHILHGNQVATVTTQAIGLAHGAGTIVKAGFTCGETGADGTDPMSMELDVTIGAVSVFSTKPKLDTVAGAVDGAHTFAAGTGVTPGVLNAAAVTVAANSIIKTVWTLIRTTPETEMADLCAYVEIEYKVGA